MSRRFTTILWAIIGTGVAIRVAIAFGSYGDGPDMRMLTYVGRGLLDDPLHVYTTLNHAPDARWFYPSGYFPWLAAITGIHDLVGLPYHGLVQLGPIAADAAIAWIVQSELGRRGRGEGVRLAAAAAVAFGPSLGIISGYQGQLDSVAILAGLLGFVAWERDGPRRALVAGLLIGLGGAIKVFPLLLLLALLPSVRSRREAITLCVAAAGIVVLFVAPWVISEPGEFSDAAIGYSGISGIGGITLVMQPGFAENFLTPFPPTVQANGLLVRVLAHNSLLNAAWMGALTLFLIRCRPRPVDAAVLVWLTVYVCATGFFFQYVIWGVPFFLLAGHVRNAILLQLAYIGPAVIFYTRPWHDDAIVIPYSAVMIAIWAALAIALARWGSRLWRDRPPQVLPARTAAR